VLIKAMPNADLSIVIPARNEACAIHAVLVSMRNVFPDAEIIVVDNNSDDGTAQIAARVEGVKVVNEQRLGKGQAMRSGAIAATRPVLLFHDADAEYSISDSREVAQALLNFPVEHRNKVMAIGVRAWRLHWLPVISFAVNGLLRAIFKMRFQYAPEDILTGTRCLTRTSFLLMDTQSTSFSIETEISRKAIEYNFLVTSSSVRYSPRKHHEGKKIRWHHLPPILLESMRGKRIIRTGQRALTITTGS